MLCTDINGTDPLGGVPLDTVKVAFLVKVSQPNIQRMHLITLNLNLSNLNNRYLCLTHKTLSNEF